MKKIIVLFICFFSSVAILAQTEQMEGDDMAAEGNYSGAAMMYRLCMQEEEECLLKLIRLLYEEKVEPQFTNELYQLIMPLAEKGNAEAQFYLGIMYLKGFDNKDSDKSFEWLKKSAEQGNADAQFQLGQMYQKGMGVKQDMDEALRWYRKSLAQGHEAAKNSYDELLHITQAEKEVQEQKQEEQAAQVEPEILPSPQLVDKKPDNLYIKNEKSKTPIILFAAGGVCLAAGTAITYLGPTKLEYDYSNSAENGNYLEIKKRNPVFMIAGAVAGGVCIGTGIVMMKKAKSQSKNYAFESDGTLLPHNPSRDARLFFVAYENGAGLRLTF